MCTGYSVYPGRGVTILICISRDPVLHIEGACHGGLASGSRGVSRATGQRQGALVQTQV